MPSEVFGEEDSLAAWMLDNAVTWLGITIENALQERVKVGYGKNVEFKPKYTLSRLLHPLFRLPKPAPEPDFDSNPWSPFFPWIGKRNSNVKQFKHKSLMH